MPGTPSLAIWIIAACTTAGIIVRPFRLPEAVWAALGAAVLVCSGLLPWRSALAAADKGTDVYLFLTGMMLLSEIARREGVFDWLAAKAVGRAGGSGARLFVLVFAVATGVTAILSNDATAVVLTPAVFAVTRKARVDAAPYLFICAFVANAASFLLPISNPANLVLYDGQMPALASWLGAFFWPSVLAIVATFAALYRAERRRIDVRCAREVQAERLGFGGRIALGGIVVTALALLTVSESGIALGLPTAVLGLLTATIVLCADRAPPTPLLAEISWSILPLVAGLFVLVAALDRTGLVAALAASLKSAATEAPMRVAAGAGALAAFGSNLTNNLPMGLFASTMLARAHAGRAIADCILIGVDLGPNLSITGSLATILWLTAIRREGETIGFWRFLKLGCVVMPPALVLALAARLLLG